MSAVLESQYIGFEVSDSGSYQALDKLTQVTWFSKELHVFLGVEGRKLKLKGKMSTIKREEIITF